MMIISLKPYDAVSYLYGRENDYTEHGSASDSFHVKDEKLSVIRNELGFEAVFPKDNWIQGFFHGSWVYEYYFNENSYKAAFVGTDVYGTYHQIIPTRNLGLVHTGFKGEHKDFAWKLAFTGLYGRRFSENSVSFKGDYKF